MSSSIASPAPAVPVFVSFQYIASVIPVSVKTLQNKDSLGVLPFPSHLVLGKRVVRLSDLESYLASFTNSPTPPESVISPIPASPAGKRRGRPTNASKAAAIASKQAAEVSHA